MRDFQRYSEYVVKKGRVGSPRSGELESEGCLVPIFLYWFSSALSLERSLYCLK